MNPTTKHLQFQLIFAAQCLLSHENCAAFKIPLPDGRFMVCGTEDEIRSLTTKGKE